MKTPKRLKKEIADEAEQKLKTYENRGACFSQMRRLSLCAVHFVLTLKLKIICHNNNDHILIIYC